MLAFVYGTLTDPAQVERVVGDYRFEGPATLVGLRRVEGRYPTLAPPRDVAGGASADGRLLRTPEVARLDAYEGVDRGLYVRTTVPLEGGSAEGRDDEVAVYVGNPDRLDAPAEWPGGGPFERRVRAYLRESEVAVERRRDGTR